MINLGKIKTLHPQNIHPISYGYVHICLFSSGAYIIFIPSMLIKLHEEASF